MITVDGRAGSGLAGTGKDGTDVNNLIPYLKSMSAPVQRGTLKYGDVSFIGNGPGGRAVTVGIEVKSTLDFLDTMTNGRLVGTQLPGMQRVYEFPFIFIHGRIRPATDGVLEIHHERWNWIKPKRTVMVRDLKKFLYTMKFVHGVDFDIFPDIMALANEVYYLYDWWTSKEWEEHESGQAFDFSSQKTYLHQPSFERSIAKELPGIGWKKSMEVVRHIGTFENMAMADKAKWASVPGIGKTLAHRIWCTIRGKREGRG